MVMVDIQMPENCEECPCSYTCMNGPNRLRMMCNAIEYNHSGDCFVDEYLNERPEKCPMHEMGVMYVYKT